MPVIKTMVHTGNCRFGIQWNKINDLINFLSHILQSPLSCSFSIFFLISIRTISYNTKVYLWKSLRSWVLFSNEQLHKQFPIIRKLEDLGMDKTLQLFIKFWMTLFSYSISLNWSCICFCNCYSAPGRSCAKRSTCKAELPSLPILPARCWVKGWGQISILHSCWRMTCRCW